MDASGRKWHGKTDTIAQRLAEDPARTAPPTSDFMDLHARGDHWRGPSRLRLRHGKGRGERARPCRAPGARFDGARGFKPPGRIRDAYKALSDEFEATLLANVNSDGRRPGAGAARARRDTIQQADDSMAQGAALASVKAAADKKLATAKLRERVEQEGPAWLTCDEVPRPTRSPSCASCWPGSATSSSRYATRRTAMSSPSLEVREPGEAAGLAAEMRADGYSVEVGTIGTTKTRDMV